MLPFFLVAAVCVFIYANQDENSSLSKLKELKATIKEYSENKSDTRCWFEAISMALRGERDKYIKNLLQISTFKLDDGRKRTEVDYYHGSKRYTIPIIAIKGPIENYTIYTQKRGEEKKINQDFSKYFGPNSDLHGLKLTPEDFGYIYISIDNREFHETDTLKVGMRMV